MSLNESDSVLSAGSKRKRDNCWISMRGSRLGLETSRIYVGNVGDSDFDFDITDSTSDTIDSGEGEADNGDDSDADAERRFSGTDDESDIECDNDRDEYEYIDDDSDVEIIGVKSGNSELLSKPPEREIIGPESWKHCVGFPGYEISDKGRVRNRSGKFIKLQMLPLSAGKFATQVTLFVSNKSRNVRVQKLVADAFLEPPKDKSNIIHKDGDPTNNCLENIAYVPIPIKPSKPSGYYWRNGVKRQKRFRCNRTNRF